MFLTKCPFVNHVKKVILKKSNFQESRQQKTKWRSGCMRQVSQKIIGMCEIISGKVRREIKYVLGHGIG